MLLCYLSCSNYAAVVNWGCNFVSMLKKMNVCVSVCSWLFICSLCAFVKLSEADHCASVEGSSLLAPAALSLSHPPASKSNKKYIQPESLSRDWNWLQLTIIICFCFITHTFVNRKTCMKCRWLHTEAASAYRVQYLWRDRLHQTHLCWKLTHALLLHHKS